MPKIKMLATAQGSSDGFTVTLYECGKEYEVSAALAKNFVFAQEIAEPVPAMQRKMVSTSPENKMVKATPKNKVVMARGKKKSKTEQVK